MSSLEGSTTCSSSGTCTTTEGLCAIELPTERLEFDTWIGWKTLAAMDEVALALLALRPMDGVLMGVPGWLALPPFSLNPGNTMLMSEGEGEGARDETALDTLEALRSQFWRSSNSSSLVGPPSVLSIARKKRYLHTLLHTLLAKGLFCHGYSTKQLPNRPNLSHSRSTVNMVHVYEENKQNYVNWVATEGIQINL